MWDCCTSLHNLWRGGCVYVPPDGHRQGLGGAGAGTDDFSSQPFGLKDVEEGVAGRDGPWQTETITESGQLQFRCRATFLTSSWHVQARNRSLNVIKKHSKDLLYWSFKMFQASHLFMTTSLGRCWTFLSILLAQVTAHGWFHILFLGFLFSHWRAAVCRDQLK